MAFLELLLRIWNLTGLSVPAWHFIKLVYVCLLCGAIWFQYLSLQYLWPENYKKISCCYLVLVCCNLPMIMYSSFVYGRDSFLRCFVGGMLSAVAVAGGRLSGRLLSGQRLAGRLLSGQFLPEQRLPK